MKVALVVLAISFPSFEECEAAKQSVSIEAEYVRFECIEIDGGGDEILSSPLPKPKPTDQIDPTPEGEDP